MTNPTSTPAPTAAEGAARFPIWRTGILGGLVGILCCVGPAVLALVGIVSAATAFAWATDLYHTAAWWFRLGGLFVLALLTRRELRKRSQCSRAGVRRLRWRLLGTLGIGVTTYAVLYVVTSWLGTLA